MKKNPNMEYINEIYVDSDMIRANLKKTRSTSNTFGIKGEEFESFNLTPTIFKKNMQNNLKLRPFNDMISDVGDIQYFPGWSKEWRNSVYHYNSNLMKNFPVNDINIVKIIKSYFNIYFNHQFLKYKHVLNRKRRLSYNKIFFASPEIKHTNLKGIVTLYTFNRENLPLKQKINFVSFLIWKLSCILRSGKGTDIKLLMRRRIISSEWIDKCNYYFPEELSKLQKKLNVKNHLALSKRLKKRFLKKLRRIMNHKLYLLRIRKWIWSKPKLKTFNEPLLGYLNKLEKMFFKFHFIFVLAHIFNKNMDQSVSKGSLFIDNKGAPFISATPKYSRLYLRDAKIKGVIKDINLLQDFYAYFSALESSQIKGKEQANKWVKIIFKSELTIIRKYKFKLNLNKYKFEGKFLAILSNILSKIYSKQIEFNIVNLKNIVFNTDLFTEISTKKIQKQNTRVSKIINTMLNKAKLPIVNRIKEKGRIVKSVNYNLVENKYRTLDLKNILTGQLHLDKLLNNNYLNYLKYSLNFGYAPLSVLYNLVFNSIKYKNLHGIKMEVKGRLTPRYRADRSVYKVKWKGGLKNIASSYKGLPVRKSRGHLNPNVSYSLFSSKRRVGAFAVKGWTGGKF